MVSLDGTRTRPAPADRQDTAVRCSSPLAVDALAVHSSWRVRAEEADAAARIAEAVDRLRAEPQTGADHAWLGFLHDHMQAAAFVFRAASGVLDAAARSCTWPTLRRLIELEASMQERQAQALVLYVMDLEGHFGPAPIEESRRRWETAEAWAPARSFLNVARQQGDWAEVLSAVNLCFEPLVGQLLRRELGMATAAVHGDHTTPVVAAAGQAEWAWARGWTVELLELLLEDRIYGDHNRSVLTGWLARWLPPGLEAAYASAGIAAGLPEGSNVDGALDRVLADHRGLLADACLELVP